METGIKKAVSLAIEGGYPKNRVKTTIAGEIPNPEKNLLDHLFWQCLGKSLGWEKHRMMETRLCKAECSKCGETRVAMQAEEWRYNWLLFIDHLAERKDVDEFFKDLLSKRRE